MLVSMTAIDSKGFLSNGGYLQKGREKNIRPEDLGRRTYDLVPSRYAISTHLLNRRTPFIYLFIVFRFLAWNRCEYMRIEAMPLGTLTLELLLTKFESLV